mgnify:FL=1
MPALDSWPGYGRTVCQLLKLQLLGVAGMAHQVPGSWELKLLVLLAIASRTSPASFKVLNKELRAAIGMPLSDAQETPPGPLIPATPTSAAFTYSGATGLVRHHRVFACCTGCLSSVPGSTTSALQSVDTVSLCRSLLVLFLQPPCSILRAAAVTLRHHSDLRSHIPLSDLLWPRCFTRGHSCFANIDIYGFCPTSALLYGSLVIV